MVSLIKVGSLGKFNILTKSVGPWQATEVSLRALYTANEGLNTPHSLPAMASPPTVTSGAGSTTAPPAPYAGQTQAFTYIGGSTAIAYLGGGDIPNNSGRRFPVTTIQSGGNVSATENSVYWRVTVDVNAAAVSFRIAAGSSSSPGWRFIVDGQYVNKSFSQTAAGGRGYFTLDFGTKAKRRIVIESQQSRDFYGVYVAPGDTVEFPSTLEKRMLVVLGDSFTASTGADVNADGWAVVFGEKLGFWDIWASGSGGTGYVNPGTGNSYKLADRLDADLNRAIASAVLKGTTIAKIVFAMGVNDGSYEATEIQAQAAYCFARARQLVPAASISVQTGFNTAAPSAPSANYTKVKNAVIAAAAGVPGVRVVDTQNWAFETDGTSHPTTAGHYNIGTAAAAGERAALAV